MRNEFVFDCDMKFKHLILYILIGVLTPIQAQELTQLKDYNSNCLYNINPAAAGYDGGFNSQLSYTKSWVGMPGSPECQIFSNSIRLGEEEFYNPKSFIIRPLINLSNHVSLGFTLFNETEGPLQHIGFMFAYAYHIALDNMRLSLGLSGMLTQYHLNTSYFDPSNPNDPNLYTNTTALIPDINAGVLLYDRLFYVGASANGLANFDQIMDHQQTQPDLVLFSGNKFEVNDRYIIEPSLFGWRYGTGTYSMDINAKIYYLEDNWLLLSYHTTGEMIIGIGIKLRPGLKLGYTYTLSTNGLTSLFGGSQNISLLANIEVLKKKYYYSW